MAATHVGTQFASGFAPNGSPLVTGTGTGAQAFPGNVTAGNGILVAVKWGVQGATVTSITGVRGTYASLVGPISHTSASGRLQMFIAYNITAGAETITVNFSGPNAQGPCYIAAMEVQGVPTTDPTDTGINSSDNAEAGTAVDAPAITPSVNGCLVFGAVAQTNNLGTFTPDSPFTEGIEISDASFETLEIAYYEQATAASVTAAWTATTTNNCMAMAASILPGAGGGGGGDPTNNIFYRRRR